MLYIEQLNNCRKYENTNNSLTSRNNYDMFVNFQHVPQQVFSNNFKKFSKIPAVHLKFNEEKIKINNISNELFEKIDNRRKFTDIGNFIKKETKLSDTKLCKYSLSTNNFSIKNSTNRITFDDGSNSNVNVLEPELTNFAFNRDTMQRKSSRACHATLKSSKGRNRNPGSSILTNNHYNSHYSSNCLTGKQRKSQIKHTHHDLANSSSNIATNGEKLTRFSRLSDLQSYKKSFKSSTVEDHMIANHNSTHRNSTSSATAASEDSNSSSSHDDLCLTYLIKKKCIRKDTKSRQKKQQQQQNRNPHNQTPDISNVNIKDHQDVDDETKENLKAKVGKQITRNSTLNLRKQCTKAAAMKSVFNNSKLLNASFQNLRDPLSISSISLSSSSSTTSINSSTSSSASNSPIHSANSSPTTSPTITKRNTEHLKKTTLSSPLRQFIKLNMNEQQLVQQLRRYVIDPSLLRVYGFPVDSIHHTGCVEIYKCLPKHLAEEAITEDNQRHHCHFYGRNKFNIINSHDDLYSSSYSQQTSNNLADSGLGSGESTPRFTDSDSSEMGEDDLITPIMAFYTPDGVYQIFSEYCNSLEKQCVRCSKIFQVNEKGEYMSFDPCIYHWGKLSNVYNGKCFVNIYSCCQGEELSEGCSKHSLHVWNGSVVGINGPYTDFVHTEKKEKKRRQHSKIYAIDCEMSYTGLGLEVTKVTVVGYDGSIVYEHFVHPKAEIIDYNTRFSGVSEKDFSPLSNNSIKTFAEVQTDLLNLFDADTILIGHGLDNDLKVLRLVHKTVVDTSVIFSHSTGYPYRRSLKNLTKSFLKRDIQCGDTGHSSFEDSRACLELMMWKIRKDLRHWNYQ